MVTLKAGESSDELAIENIDFVRCFKVVLSTRIEHIMGIVHEIFMGYVITEHVFCPCQNMSKINKTTLISHLYGRLKRKTHGKHMASLLRVNMSCEFCGHWTRLARPISYPGMYIQYIYIYISGWWLTYPYEKIWKSVGIMTFPTEWEK